MHEMPIATEIVDNAIRLAAQHEARFIERIEVQIGAMRQIVPEALHLAFEVISRETIAEGAALEIEEIPIEALCRNCDHRFGAEIGQFMCPKCSQADVRIVAGDDIILKSMICHTEESAQP